jgi:hypothetical protein
MVNTAEIFICSCHGEGVIVRKDEDFTYVAIWGYPNNVTLWYRIKQAWWALKGQSCTEVVLDPDTTVSLANSLK